MSATPISPISPLTRSLSLGEPEAAGASTGGTVFGQILNQVLTSNEQTSTKANQAVEDLAAGRAEDMHSVSLAVAEADLSFRLILQLRNKLTDAYNAVIGMQV
jgi:flagellar hook-basal body complex protein FliE